jgi:hypothetical protein
MRPFDVQLWRQHDPHLFWRSLDSSLGRVRVPVCENVEAAHFHQFSKEKVAAVCKAISDVTVISTTLFTFQSVGVSDVIGAMHRLSDKCCMLDQVPIMLFKSIADCPFLVEQFSKSMQAG